MDRRFEELLRKVRFAAAAKAMFEEMFLRDLRRTDNAHPLLQANINVGNVAYGSLGTSAVMVAGTLYVSEIFVQRSMLVTNISCLNGATVGTDNLIFALYDAAGRRLAHTALAGVLSAGANAFQTIALTTPFDLRTDGRYWLGLQCNGTTATTRRMAASTFLNRTGSSTGTFGTVPGAITPPATFTADVGPIGYLS